MTAPKMKMEMDTSKVEAWLLRKSLKGRKKVKVTIGYAMPYAVYVHENLEANHPRGGQAKYLEQPARQYSRRLADIVRRSVQAKNGLTEGCTRAGEELLRLSQPLVPVDKGDLKASGFVTVEEQ